MTATPPPSVTTEAPIQVPPLRSPDTATFRVPYPGTSTDRSARCPPSSNSEMTAALGWADALVTTRVPAVSEPPPSVIPPQVNCEDSALVAAT